MDSKRLEVFKNSSKKEWEKINSEESVVAETKQLLQEVCNAQSDSSVWCMVEAKRLADIKENAKIMTTAIKNLFSFVNQGTLSKNFLINSIKNSR